MGFTRSIQKEILWVLHWLRKLPHDMLTVSPRELSCAREILFRSVHVMS